MAWYDANARIMPWRVGPQARRAGDTPDPYRIWLSEVMLQQTTVAAVKDYFHRFTMRWPTVTALAAAADEDVMAAWAGLGYYARARNLLKCARVVVADHGGQFPTTRDGLLGLPGIGPYTAAAIAAIAYDLPETVVDGNVERVMARLHDLHLPLPTAKPELIEFARRLTPRQRPGDYAQAVMDLGATICTPKSPACGICPWRAPCAARSEGTAQQLPKKLPKKPKPIRLGIAYVGRRTDGAFLLQRRPDKGLLGGMLGWPGSEWAEIPPQESPPVAADWRDLGAEARHTFTHFHLRLAVRVAVIPPEAQPDVGAFIPHDRFRPSDLPTVMRKAFDLARASFEYES
ncbi:putative A/G-specific adenine glycosylase YfhQ [Thalassovita gelatinovora]|uniref:Adenine DNA glycosylase n=1 Tax=Thalassovita gelatinovora TaxID=53501 RepID=A0A0P1FVX9_THAGE|nr:putative A/G-specific adenine glycosylase YfhQ [Thalassovita gelatinovora]SEP96053.1 A/G-specific DNA-adenine glycosylase [Thalassovita gelatinovora]